MLTLNATSQRGKALAAKRLSVIEVTTLVVKEDNRKMSDSSKRDHVTLPNSKWRQYLHRLFIPVERRLIAA